MSAESGEISTTDTTRSPIREAYLGDGLYCSFDGYQLWLRAPRLDGDHVIALEPSTFSQFIQFARSVGITP